MLQPGQPAGVGEVSGVPQHLSEDGAGIGHGAEVERDMLPNFSDLKPGPAGPGVPQLSSVQRGAVLGGSGLGFYYLWNFMIYGISSLETG